MEITCPAVTLGAREVRVGDLLALQHVSVEFTAVRVTLPLGTGPLAAQAILQVVINEAELNRLVAGRDESGLRDLSFGLLTGKVRFAGRYELMGPLAVPFSLVAVPEIVGGTHIRLDMRDFSVVGAALPGFSAQMIGERINGKLAESLSVERLGIPIRLTAITVEPGRLTVTGETTVEIRPWVASGPAIPAA
ncbi:MAG: DUF2993 domain-containing protein [Armatimonadetes bacterium]|nr:DUF2993 domain-containing protein [Armatimonadota bacterium]